MRICMNEKQHNRHWLDVAESFCEGERPAGFAVFVLGDKGWEYQGILTRNQKDTLVQTYAGSSFPVRVLELN